MGPGAELEQALERFGGLRREKTEAITRQARYFARDSSRTRRLAASATHACAPAIRCKACMLGARLGRACFCRRALAEAGAATAAARTVAVTSATSWLGGRGE